ncbi:MAG: TrkA C-terminal domain-containing protein [Lachnospirales bacterium]
MYYIFITICILYTLMVKVYSILFQISGLSKQKSLFQVASILTSTGFSTKESEIVTVDNTRRKLVFSLMIIGYISTITLISATVYMLLKEFSLTQFLVAALYLCFAILIINTKFMTFFIKEIVSKFGNKFFYGELNNNILVLQDFGNKILAEITINELPSPFKENSIKDVVLFNEYDLNLLSIQRKNVTITSVNGDHIIKQGDKLVVYGDIIKLTYVFQTMVKNESLQNEI